MKNRLQRIRIGLIGCAVASLGLVNGQLFAQSGEKPTAGSAVKTMAKKMEGGSGAKKMDGSASKTMEAGSMEKKMDSGSMAKDSMQGGSGAKEMMNASLGLEGFCPVCIVKGKGWVKGDPQIQSVYDGKKYYFPSADVKQMFDDNPVAFTPALGGDCTVCLKMLGKRVPGNIRFGSTYQGRLFLFPDEEVKQKFIANPTEFADVDLASGGDCTVCAVEKQRQVTGSSDFAIMHKGMRYLFPGVEQMNMFAVNPAKYEVADPMMAK